MLYLTCRINIIDVQYLCRITLRAAGDPTDSSGRLTASFHTKIPQTKILINYENAALRN